MYERSSHFDQKNFCRNKTCYSEVFNTSNEDDAAVGWKDNGVGIMACNFFGYSHLQKAKQEKKKKYFL